MGVLASLVAAFLVAFMPETSLESSRELYFDRLTQLFPLPQSPDIAVVDIDRKAYALARDQKWQRADTAALVEKIAAQKPSVIAFDLVFSTDCDAQMPANRALAAALARRLPCSVSCSAMSRDSRRIRCRRWRSRNR
jgi:adenylate cyclase